MKYEFISARKITEPLHALISIAGPSGCGKTFSAMVIAESLADGKPFCVIDTEARRALHYKNRFDFVHCDFGPMEGDNLVGYPAARYVEVIEQAEKAGFPVIVVDSFSHCWEGTGGTLEAHDIALERLSRGDAAKREKLNLLAWGQPEVKPAYRKLVQRIIQCRAHVILCLRAKDRAGTMKGGRMEYVGKSKIRREDLPYDVVADKDLTFEMTCALLLTPESVGVPIPLKLPDEVARAFPTDRQISAETGKVLLQWSTSHGASGRADKSVLDSARAEARKGFAAVNDFWKGLNDGDRAMIRPIMGELKRLAEAADKVDDDIPFGTDADDDDDGEAYQREVERKAEEAMRGKSEEGEK